MGVRAPSCRRPHWECFGTDANPKLLAQRTSARHGTLNTSNWVDRPIEPVVHRSQSREEALAPILAGSYAGRAGEQAAADVLDVLVEGVVLLAGQ